MLSVYVAVASYVTALKARMEDDRGATAVEYGLMLAFVAAAVVLTAATLGDKIVAEFEEINTNWPA